MSELPIGKTLPNARYIHTCALSLLPDEFSDLIDEAAKIAEAPPTEFNVVKFDLARPRISLLHYPLFFEDGFPALEMSWTVDLSAGTASVRTYARDANPPILHRKETLIPPDHGLAVEFRRLTRDAEEAGLLEDVEGIGREDAWNIRLQRVGLVVRGNELVEIDRPIEEPEEQIARHKTALVRYSLSAPMQQFWKHGYLDGEYSVFDYGCGRGDDVRALSGRGIQASGWDPHFADESPRKHADVVNLGFVLNVIEDVREREEALRGAWSYAEKVLAVAVMLGGRSIYERYRLYRDGVVTRRGTFQKYFRQNELREYIADTLDRDPIAMCPGIFLVFKDEEEEQRFLARRQLSRPPVTPLARPSRRPAPARRPPKPSKWETHRELIEAFWQECRELGRIPEVEEFERAGELRDLVGTPKTVYRRCAEEFGEESIFEAQEVRKADRLIFLALNLFERRHSMNKLPEAVRRDVKAFWGSYATASTEAKSLLFSSGSPETILAGCHRATKQGLGYLEGERSFTFHSSVANRLAPALRVYLGCASRIYGDFDQADLIKIHIGTQKVSLMEYDDFEVRAIPLLLQRTKIFLGGNDYDVFEYVGEYAPQPLCLKSRYLPEGFPRREDQIRFDEKLATIVDLGFDGHGPNSDELQAVFDEHGLAVRGFRLQRKPKGHTAGDVPLAAGSHLTVEASSPIETQTSYDSADEISQPADPSLGSLKEERTGRLAGMTILEAITAVLRKSETPMTAVEIHQAISREGLFEFKAKDPKGVISSTIGKHLRTAGPHSVEKATPGTFKAS